MVFPLHLTPETGADRTPRESSLACMTANREPSNQSFEIDREATVCTASRRFLPLCGRETTQRTARPVWFTRKELPGRAA
jgi:hypothetical protein